MKIHELIAKLSKFDPELEVYFGYYEINDSGTSMETGSSIVSVDLEEGCLAHGYRRSASNYVVLR